MQIFIKYKNIYFFTLLLSICVVFTNFAFSNQGKIPNKESKSKVIPAMAEVTTDFLRKSIDNEKKQPIRMQVLLLKKLSERDIVSAREKLEVMQKNGLVLNEAEQYLLYLARANIDNVKGQGDKVIHWLTKAIELETLIPENQLESPNFASVYLLLANTYAQQGDYQAAFDNKKKYIKKHFSYLKQQTELRVKGLNEKYEITKKNEENKMLEQKNELKNFELERAAFERNQQNMNITVIVLAVALFFFLLFRQFKISRTLQKIAKIDGLTKLVNKKNFLLQGENYMSSALKATNELCVIVIDIDHLKHINDALGRDVGDNVICQIADLANETMRSRDVLARIDGEEFAALLPDATIGQAKAIAERIREKIQTNLEQDNIKQDNIEQELLDEHTVSCSSIVNNVTVSIGLASIKDIQTSFDSLLGAAGIAMYKAKANGGNNVYTYTSNDKT